MQFFDGEISQNLAADFVEMGEIYAGWEGFLHLGKSLRK